jgi:hypothetical protein
MMNSPWRRSGRRCDVMRSKSLSARHYVVAIIYDLLSGMITTKPMDMGQRAWESGGIDVKR